MASISPTSPGGDLAALLQEILSSVRSLQQEHSHLASALDAINGRVNTLAGIKEVHDQATKGTPVMKPLASHHHHHQPDGERRASPLGLDSHEASHTLAPSATSASPALPASPSLDGGRKSSTSSRIILTSYPGQSGVDPLPMDWGNKDPNLRGPVVVSRNHTTIRKRNGKPSN